MHLSNSSLLVSVSIKFTYSIHESVFIDWQAASTSNNAIIGHNSASSNTNNQSSISDDLELIDDKESDYYPNIRELPFGAVQDPIE
jgi:hypothetical protein